ncbi:MAG: hypothetical protein DMF64_15700 [Acidobacteria bacterium]|nr:MAG: hypothetical protein DMF64_15700 [Acidobacteriota bacterium]
MRLFFCEHKLHAKTQRRKDKSAKIKENFMREKNPMICPVCGVAMNHHADKIDYNVEAHDAAAVDPDLGGVVEEAHTCPECGQTFVRAERVEA